MSEHTLHLVEVVDLLIGQDQEHWVETDTYRTRNGSSQTITTVFHRDDEYHQPMMTEADVKNISRMLTLNGPFYTLDVGGMIEYEIDEFNYVRKRIGCSETVFSEQEKKQMLTDFVERLVRRLRRYSQGRRIEYRTFDNGRIGFRYGVGFY